MTSVPKGSSQASSFGHRAFLSNFASMISARLRNCHSGYFRDRLADHRRIFAALHRVQKASSTLKSSTEEVPRSLAGQVRQTRLPGNARDKSRYSASSLVCQNAISTESLPGVSSGSDALPSAMHRDPKGQKSPTASGKAKSGYSRFERREERGLNGGLSVRHVRPADSCPMRCKSPERKPHSTEARPRLPAGRNLNHSLAARTSIQGRFRCPCVLLNAGERAYAEPGSERAVTP